MTALRPPSRITTSLVLGAWLACGFTWAQSPAPDLDGDGIPNIVDPDIDNDGIPNALDKNIDGGIARGGALDGKYIGDHLRNSSPAEKDIDADGLPNDSLGELDIDGDGLLDDDIAELDIDGDGRLDDSLSETDIDGDGRPDDALDEDDIDGDGVDDEDDDDIDGDGLLNSDPLENDTDGDGRDDDDPNETDVDGDGVEDFDDPDDDNDLIADEDDDDLQLEPNEFSAQLALTRSADAPPTGTAQLLIRQLGTGKIAIDLNVANLADGGYKIFIAGVAHAGLTVVGGTAGTRLETNPNRPGEIAIDFPVFNQPITVNFGGVEFFTGTIPGP